MMYNVVKAELISNKSEWSMGSDVASESKCVKLTLENPDDWQDEGGVFIFFQEQCLYQLHGNPIRTAGNDDDGICLPGYRSWNGR